MIDHYYVIVSGLIAEDCANAARTKSFQFLESVVNVSELQVGEGVASERTKRKRKKKKLK